MDETNRKTLEVWEAMSGAAPLREIYGYWPTFHDAYITALSFETRDRQLTLDLYYYDLPEGAAGDVHTFVRMVFRGVKSLDYSKERNYIDGMDFERTSEGILSSFRDQECYLLSTIEAEDVAVLEVSPVIEIGFTPEGHDQSVCRIRLV